MADLEALMQAVINGKRKKAMDLTLQAIAEGVLRGSPQAPD
jgi:hypothetical protein